MLFTNLINGVIAVHFHGFGNNKNNIRGMFSEKRFKVGFSAEYIGFDFFIGKGFLIYSVANISADMKETAENIADALGEPVSPFIGANDNGVQSDNFASDEELLKLSEEAVDEFPEYIYDKEGGKDNGAGVALALDHIEESHGKNSHIYNEAFIVEVKVFFGQVVSGAVYAEAQAEEDESEVDEQEGFGIVVEITKVAESKPDTNEKCGIKENDIEEEGDQGVNEAPVSFKKPFSSEKQFQNYAP